MVFSSKINHCKSFKKLHFKYQEPYACTHAFQFIIQYKNPGRITLHTEYLLYDLISTIGNVGGTLGLFIGISFSGVFSTFLNIFVIIVNWIDKRIKMKNRINIIQVQEISEEKHSKLQFHRISCILDSFVPFGEFPLPIPSF